MKKRKLIKRMEKLVQLLERMQGANPNQIPADAICFFTDERCGRDWICAWGDFQGLDSESNIGTGDCMDVALLNLRSVEPRMFPIITQAGGTEMLLGRMNDDLRTRPTETHQDGTVGEGSAEDALDRGDSNLPPNT